MNDVEEIELYVSGFKRLGYHGLRFGKRACKEKIWKIVEKVLVLVRVLYDFKSTGSSWRAALAQAMRDVGFISTLADPAVWLRKGVRDDGSNY